MEYLLHLGILVGVYVILAQSFNLNFGLGKMFNLAHIAAYALGAYTTAILSTDYGVGCWTALSASAGVTALFSLLIGGIALRLSHDYFAIGSWAFSAVVTALLVNWKSLTRGVLGIPGIPRPTIAGIELVSNELFLLFVIVLDCIVLLVCYCAFYGRFGRMLRGLSEHDGAAQSLGQPTSQNRTLSFALSSACAGLAGAVFAYYINYIDPSSFSLTEMVFILTITVVGRPGSYWGTVFATVFLVLLPEPLRFIDIPPSILGPMRQLLYALILFTVVYLRRAALFPMEREI